MLCESRCCSRLIGRSPSNMIRAVSLVTTCSRAQPSMELSHPADARDLCLWRPEALLLLLL